MFWDHWLVVSDVPANECGYDQGMSGYIQTCIAFVYPFIAGYIHNILYRCDYIHLYPISNRHSEDARHDFCCGHPIIKDSKQGTAGCTPMKIQSPSPSMMAQLLYPTIVEVEIDRQFRMAIHAYHRDFKSMKYSFHYQ